MANTNTINSQISGSIQNTFATMQGSVVGTTETAFSLNASLTGIGGGVIPLSLEPGIWSGGRPFKLRAYGIVTTGVTTNFQFALYQVPATILAAGTQATLSNDQKLAASTARAVNSTNCAFSLEATLQYSPASGLLHGTAKFVINNSLDAEATVTARTITGDTDLNFILSGLLSAGNSTCNVVVSEFSAEQV